MSDHRVELGVSFTVSDGTDGGRAAAEKVFERLEVLGMLGDLKQYDFTVAKGAVDGVGWYEKWPDAPAEPEPFFEPGKTYLSANRAFEFTCERVIDGVAIGREREFDPRWNPANRRVWHSVMPEGCWTEVAPPLNPDDIRMEGLSNNLTGRVMRYIHHPTGVTVDAAGSFLPNREQALAELAERVAAHRAAEPGQGAGDDD